MDHTKDPVNQIVDIRIIPPGRAISINRDFLALINQAGEFMNGHLRPLPRTIGRENSQAGDIHPVEMMIRIAEKLPGPFGCSVRGDGLDIKILFREGNSLIFPIDRG